jgi:hypothetical protein
MEGSPLKGALKQGPVPLGRKLPSRLAFPTGCADVWRVRLSEPAEATSVGSVPPAYEVACPTRFSLTETGITLPDVIRRLDFCLRHISQFRQPKFARVSEKAVSPRSQATKIPCSSVQRISLVKHGVDCRWRGGVGRIRVDIEKIRRDVHTTSLAERFFSVRECDGLRALPDDLRVAGFFACWRKAS